MRLAEYGPVVAALAAALALSFGLPAEAQQSRVEQLYADLAKLPRDARQTRIEEGARAEGLLTLIHSWRGETAEKHIALFNKRYPFVRVENTDLGAQDATERLVAEEVAGRHLTDLITTGIDEGEPGLPYAASYPTPALDNILPGYKKLIYPENRMIPFYWAEHGITYNPTLVPAHAIPKSWDDLCSPALKGKASYDPIDVYYLNGLYAVLGERAFDLLKCIGANDPIISRGHTVRLELMMAGDHWVQGDNFIYRGIMLKDKDKNAAIAVDWNVPVIGDAGTAMINKNTPHPYAAALFTDWMLGEDSQKYADSEYRNPIAVPNSHFPKDAKTVPYGPTDPQLTTALVETWNKFVLKR